MSAESCSNCESLREQCQSLKTEVAALNEKLNDLFELFFRETSNHATQTPPPINNYGDDEQPISRDEDPLSVTVTNVSLCDPLLDIYCTVPNVNSNPGRDLSIVNNEVIPFTLIPGQSFSQFKFDLLEKETNFTRIHGNRSTCLYSPYPYKYGGTIHPPSPVPAADSYIATILNHLNTNFPEFKYNSVLLTKYHDGRDFLGFHSDNEREIVSGSHIVTITLGQTRSIVFKALDHSSMSCDEIVTLNPEHGDVFVMNTASQSNFEHSVPADTSTCPRISITCRLLQAPVEQILPLQSPCLQLSEQVSPIPHEVSQSGPSSVPKKPVTVYISSSMFRSIDEAKMSSKHQDAKVLFYPGATAADILSKLKEDVKFSQIDPTCVKKIYLLCGTNNVDRVLNIQRHDQANYPGDHVNVSQNVLEQCKHDIASLTNFLHSWAPIASVNILNVFPRTSACRNFVINEINQHIFNLSQSCLYINMVSTEYNRSLFSYKNGHRKNIFFNNHGIDNVHFSKSGIVRLAKYLKFSAHQDD